MAIISSNLQILHQLLKERELSQLIINYIQDCKTKVPDIRTRDFLKVPLTKEVYAIEQSLKAVALHETVFESHRKHVDIQFILEGFEIFGMENNSALQIKEEYSLERDVMFYHTPLQFSEIKLSTGWFGIYFPEDCHLCRWKKDDKAYSLVKTVIKVPLECFKSFA